MSILRVLLALALTALFALLPRAAAAQGGNITVTLTPAAVAFPAPGIADFDVGWIDHPGLTVSITSRPSHAAWELRIRATDPGMGGYGKPLTDLLWRADGSSVWLPISQAESVVVQATGDTDVTIYFRLLLDWESDLPGSYATGLTFSALRL